MNKRTTKKLALKAFEMLKINLSPNVKEQKAFIKYSKNAIKYEKIKNH